MRAGTLLGPAALLLGVGTSWAMAQDAPESLLPPGFDQPRPAPSAHPRPPRAPNPARAPAAPPASAPERVRAAAPASAAATASPAPRAAAPSAPPGAPSAPLSASSAALPLSQAARAGPAARSVAEGGPLPPLEVLEQLGPAQLDAALGLAATADMPPGARRSPEVAGIIDESEGGLPAQSLAGQDASLVRAAIAGNDGRLVSRWGHILLRRALASRLAPPQGMAASDFAALRAALLVRMGEGDAARALVQDIDIGDYTPALTQAALDAYVATADFTGICPMMAAWAGTRDDAQWQVAGAICDTIAGGGGGLARLDRALYRGTMPRIDLRLAQKYAGALGPARRAVTIDWTGVDDMTPWRFGLTLAVGLQPPARLLDGADPRYADSAATAPMLGLAARAAAADGAAAAGVLSSAAMVDLYGQIYADAGVGGPYADAAARLRDAYAAPALADRVAAMKTLWDGGADASGGADAAAARYSRQVLTAYAAARLPPGQALDDAAADLIAAMLAAGLDANAARWAGVVDPGSLAWAELAAADPDAAAVDGAALQRFVKHDGSDGRRKAAMLVAGLAGLGRLDAGTAAGLANSLGTTLGGDTRWTRIIDRAAAVRNPVLVALLAGVGMQGDGWGRMTPRFLLHIVRALRAAGFEPEARMIAAEAVARA